nr:hypothetical protein [Tanacetum cinerariifolium]
MDMTIDQQVALDEALVPHASRLRIGKSNFRLRSDIMSKESTLQVVYDVLRLTPFYKAGEIKKITNVNINKLHQSWKSFAAVINKCLSGKSTGYDSLRLSQAHILWGMYHKKNVDFAYLLWEDFVYQVEHKYQEEKCDVLPQIHKETLLLKRSIMLLHQEQLLPKTKASVRKTQSSSDTTMPPPTAAGTRLLTSTKGKQPAKSSKAKGLSVLSEVALTEAEHIKLATKRSLQQTHISQASGSGADEETSIIPGDEDEQDDNDQDDNDDDQDSDNDDDEFVHPKLFTHDEEAKDEESFDPIVQTPSQVENYDDESNDDESHGINVRGDEGPDAEDDDEELFRDVNINLEGHNVQMTDVHTTQVLEDTRMTLTPVNPYGHQQSSSVSS